MMIILLIKTFFWEEYKQKFEKKNRRSNILLNGHTGSSIEEFQEKIID